MPETPRILTVQEAAERLGCTIHKVYRRIYRGDLPAELVQTQWAHYRITEADLEAYIAAGGPDRLSTPRRYSGYMSASEVANLTGMTPERIRNLCKLGKLSYHRTGKGGQYQIVRESAMELLEQQVA